VTVDPKRPDQPSSDEDVRESFEDAAEAAQRPHDDEAERRRAQEAAREAGRNPRREGEGIHPKTNR
jgi:hypothetical protein